MSHVPDLTLNWGCVPILALMASELVKLKASPALSAKVFG